MLPAVVGENTYVQRSSKLKSPRLVH